MGELGERPIFYYPETAIRICCRNKKKEDKPAPVQEKQKQMSFVFFMNYDCPLTVFVRAGRFRRVDDIITEDHFPCKRTDRECIEVKLFPFPAREIKNITREEIVAELTSVGFRLAELQETLATEAMRSGSLSDMDIRVIGSVLEDSDAKRCPAIQEQELRCIPMFSSAKQEVFYVPAVRK